MLKRFVFITLLATCSAVLLCWFIAFGLGETTDTSKTLLSR